MNFNALMLSSFLSLVLVPMLAQETPSDVDLVQAIQRSDLGNVRRSIAGGADVNGKDKVGTTALMYAAAYSTVECMQLLLDSGATPNVANNAGATALMWSAGDLRKVRLLLAKGADVNTKANSGRTPLMIAASYAGNVETVKLLLSKGAHVKGKASMGGPVFAAANAGDEAILQVLLALLQTLLAGSPAVRAELPEIGKTDNRDA